MRTQVRKNIVLSERLDVELRRLAAARGTTQSGLIAHLLCLGMAAESGEEDSLLRYLGVIEGPADLSQTIDETVYAS